jgi:nucleoside-diphosphate-sugar epimerase
MTILVTGGSGLIGWRVTEQLVRAGHEVVVFDLKPAMANLDLIEGRFEVVAGDVCDTSLLLRTLAAHDVTHIIHLAAMIGAPSALHPGRCFEVNTVATARLFDAALATGVSRVVWASSIMACGIDARYQGEPVEEDYNGAPTTAYGASKLGAEITGGIYRDVHGLENICIRPCLAFGIGREGVGSGFLAEAVRNAARGRPVKLYGHRIPHQPIYDRDMAAMFVKATFAPMPSSLVFNTPVLRNYSLDEMKAAFLEIFPKADIEIALFQSDYLPPPIVSGSRAMTELDFSPTVSFEQALREMAEFYRSVPD